MHKTTKAHRDGEPFETYPFYTVLFGINQMQLRKSLICNINLM